MCILLPVVGVCCLFSILRKAEVDWRVSYLQTTLLLFLYTALSTEILSVCQALTGYTVRLSWGLLVVVLAAVAYKKRNITFLSSSLTVYKKLPASFFAIATLWVLPLLALAIYCIPNNQDGLSYHLVRIQHWIQNKNVFYYPTNFTVQNYYNVLSEYTILHSQLLSSSDYFMNAVQCLAMLSALLAASLLAKELGASVRGQWLAVVLVLTLPMGILQSTTTQNDYLAGYFTLTAIYFGIRLSKSGSHRNTCIGYLALAIALGGFTKYSFFLIAFPFVVWFGLAYIHRYGWWAGLNLMGICLLVLLVVYGPFWYRNYQALGSILSPSSDSPLFLDNYGNEHLTGQSLLSNVSKNLAMHLALPNQRFNDALLSGMYQLHRCLGVNISDPATTMGDYKLTFTINEDTSTNCIHLLLAILSGIVVLVRPTDRIVRRYGLCLAGGLLIYSAGFKWQYFHSRTQLPLFLLMTPFIARVLSHQWVNHPGKVRLLSVLLLIMALPYIYSNNGKSIIPVRSLVKQVVVICLLPLIGPISHPISPQKSLHKHWRKLATNPILFFRAGTTVNQLNILRTHCSKK